VSLIKIGAKLSRKVDLEGQCWEPLVYRVSNPALGRPLSCRA